VSAAAATFSGNLTLSGGTANGVLYLNGSKVATSGSALTFDGTQTFGLFATGNAVTNLEGSTTNNAILRFKNGTTGNLAGFYGNNSKELIFEANGATEQMRLTSTGLGIGTSSPSNKLEVNGTVAISGIGFNANAINTTSTAARTIRLTSTGGDFYVGTESSTGGAVFPGSTAYAAVLYNSAVTPMQFWTSGVLRATLDTSGNLGIGTSSPAFALGSGLEVERAGIATLRIENSSGGNGIEIAADSTTNGIRFYGLNNAPFVFAPNATERARITSGGKFLLNTTSPVASGDEICGMIGFNGIGVKCTGGSTSFAAGFWNDATSGDNLFVNFYTETGGTLRGSITYNRAGGLVAYNVTSDYRAKDILGQVQNSGAIIDALKVYEGQMKGATQSRPMLIAHEAQEHAPYAVTGEKDAVNEDGTPKYQQMDVSALVPLLLAEIQSLRARVAQLESK
jgi:hypothetical protein